MMFMHPTPVRHTQLIAYLFPLASSEWPYSQVKVDTGASGNVLPLCLFRHLHPDHIDKTGHPAGLNVSNTRLTAYNGTLILLFGLPHWSIICQPVSPSA